MPIDIEALKTSLINSTSGHEEALKKIAALPKPANIPAPPPAPLPPPLRYPVGT